LARESNQPVAPPPSGRSNAKNILLVIFFWLFDHLAMILNQRRAQLITRALVSGTISRARAAISMREIVKSKG